MNATASPTGSTDIIQLEDEDDDETTLVNVRWFDGYLEVFECDEVRQGGSILWMRLSNGKNRTIPLSQVRWFSTDPESHEYVEPMDD